MFWLYEDNESRGTLNTGKVIAAVAIDLSAAAPHMAADKKYYIRAGCTVAAGHYLVEALWARRQVSRPILTCMLKPDIERQMIDLVVVA